MIEFLLVFVVLLAIVAAMSIGVLLGRKPIAGSCGGIGAALGEENYSCDICGGDFSKCDEQTDDAVLEKKTGLVYEAKQR